MPPTTRLPSGRTVAGTITSVLCETMPTAAVASGLVSPVDLTPAVDALWERHAEAKIAARSDGDLGMTALTAWLESRGETLVGREVVKEFRRRLSVEAMRRATVAGKPVFVRVRVG